TTSGGSGWRPRSNATTPSRSAARALALVATCHAVRYVSAVVCTCANAGPPPPDTGISTAARASAPAAGPRRAQPRPAGPGPGPDLDDGERRDEQSDREHAGEVGRVVGDGALLVGDPEEGEEEREKPGQGGVAGPREGDGRCRGREDETQAGGRDQVE